MICPACKAALELSWRRYLRSLSGKHVCPYCAATFRFKITLKYLQLWLDILIAAVCTCIGLFFGLEYWFPYLAIDVQAMFMIVLTSVSIWGTVFLVLNRRALNRLDCTLV